MNNLQNRRYKEVEPIETVEKLKKLLKKIGIEVEEKWTKQSSVDTYSLRICIKGTDMGQNGKGMTKDFAMASGYAEFFERMQNGLFRFRMEKPTKEIPFSNSPDEKRITVDELLKENNPIFKNILNQNGKGKCSENEQKEYLKTILNEKSNFCTDFINPIAPI